MKLKFPIIKTERFLLRQFIKSDLENVFKGLPHPDIIKYYGISYDSLASTNLQLEYFKNLEVNGTGCWWAICSLNNKTFYGAAGLNNLLIKHKKAEIGFWLLPEYWGQGIIKEILPQIYNYGFQQLKLHRIEAQVETENINCKKLLAKLPFQLEGTLRDCEIKNGKFISLDIYSILNEKNEK